MKKRTLFTNVGSLVAEASKTKVEFDTLNTSDILRAEFYNEDGKREMLQILVNDGRFFNLNKQGRTYLAYRLGTTVEAMRELFSLTESSPIGDGGRYIGDLTAFIIDRLKERKIVSMVMCEIDGEVWGTPSTYIPVNHIELITKLRSLDDGFTYGRLSPDRLRMVYSHTEFGTKGAAIRFGAAVENGMTGTVALGVYGVFYTADKGLEWRIEGAARTRHISADGIEAVENAIRETVAAKDMYEVVVRMADTTVEDPHTILSAIIETPASHRLNDKLFSGMESIKLDVLMSMAINNRFNNDVISALYAMAT